MKVLLVQTSFLGDTILTTPVIGALKQHIPGCELWAMATPQGCELLSRDPRLAGVLPFAKRGGDAGVRGLWRKARMLKEMRFDRVYALQRSSRTALLLALARIPWRVGFAGSALSSLYHERRQRPRHLHDVQRNLCIIDGPERLDGMRDQLELHAPAAEEINPRLRERCGAAGGWAVLVPGSVWHTKRWHAEGFRETAQYLLARGRRVLVLGSKAEAGVAEQVAAGLAAVNLAGETTLSEILYLIAHASLVVCNDSMALHAASAFKIPTVVVFCATSPAFGFGPWNNRARVVEKHGLRCKPCARHGGQRCPTGTEACMREVAAKEVIAAIEELTAA